MDVLCKPTCGRRGHAPRPTKGMPPCLPLWGRCPVRTLGGEGLSTHHPVSNRVDLQWCGVTTRVAVSNCQRRHAAPHPSRLRRATFPRGGRLWCGGTWWVRRENQRGRRGHAPALRKARRLASPSGGGAQCAHWAERAFPVHHPVSNRVTPQRWWSATRGAGSNCQRPPAAF